MIVETFGERTGVEVRMNNTEAVIYGQSAFPTFSLTGLRFRWRSLQAFNQHRPALVSTHSWEEFTQIADNLIRTATDVYPDQSYGARILTDMAHAAGSVAIEADIAQHSQTGA